MDSRESGRIQRVVAHALQRGYLTPAQLQQAQQLQRQQEAQGRPTTLLTILGERLLAPAQVAELAQIYQSSSGLVHSQVDEGGTVEAASAPAEASASSSGGQRVGPYEVRRRLGEGGMGVVLLGYDPRMHREVAIKKILGDPGSEGLRRFEREARLSAQLRHPGIAQVYDVATQGPGAPYLVMEYVAGTPLIDLCRGERLKGRRVAAILHQVCEAVAAAHAAGVLHRDLKPHNVMIAPGDRPVVLDFGLAKSMDSRSQALTRTGEILGTLAYMAPEQAEAAHHVDERADVYGLGAILYQCLTGKPPFEGSSQVNLLTALMTRDPVSPRRIDPSLHRDLETICLKCLEKDPADRYPSAQVLADELQRFLDGEPIEARPVGLATRLGRRLWRQKALLVLAVSLLIGVGLGGWYAVDRIRAGQVELERSEEKRSEAARVGDAARSKVTRGAELLQRLMEVRRYRYQPLRKPREEMALVTSARAEMQEIVAELLALTKDSPRPAPVYVHQGWAYLALLDLKEAEVCARKALDADPSLGGARLLMGRILTTRISLGTLILGGRDERKRLAPQAVEWFRRAKEAGQVLDPLGGVWEAIAAEQWELAERRIQALPVHRGGEEREFAMAVKLVLTDRPGEDIRPHLERAIEICPRMVEAHFLAGLLTLDGSSVRALRNSVASMTRVLVFQPDFAPGYRYRGKALLKLGHRAEARRDFESAVRLDPEYAPAWTGLGNLKLASGDLAGAELAYEKALRLAPQSAAVHYERSRMRVQRGDRAGAMKDLDRAIALRPGLGAAYHQRARLKEMLGDASGARSDYDQAIRCLRKPHVSLYNRSILKSKEGDAKGALADLDRAIQVDPTYTHAYNNRALLRKREGNLSGAKADLDRAIELDPKYAHAYNNRGNLKRQLNDHRGALADYAKAVKLEPDYVQAYNGVGLAKRRLNDLKGAVQAYTQALELNPKFTDAYINRAAALSRLGKTRAAAQDYERFLRVRPRDRRAGRMRAFVQKYLGRPSRY